MEEKSVRRQVNHLVVDTGAFVKNYPIFDIGINIYTVSEAINEVKDKATRDRLQVLPKDLTVREPTPDSLKIVSEFSKKTGDYPVLSAVDMRIIALTYELHKTYVGVNDLRSVPLPEIFTSHSSNVTNFPGFFSPYLQAKESENKIIAKRGEGDDNAGSHEKDCDNDNSSDIDEYDFEPGGDEECDDDIGWVTPENLQDAIKSMNSMNLDESKMEVACITTDFAMQNTLIQMGLKVVSVDGFQIKQAKTFILRCFGCMKTTSKISQRFCPHCGNKTLRRVAVTIKDDGTKTVHLTFRRPVNFRRSNYSLPAPKGGKHSKNPIVCADQPVPQNRSSKLGRTKTDVLDENYVAETSPFAINDIYTRAGHLGIRGNRNNQACYRKPKGHKYKK